LQGIGQQYNEGILIGVEACGLIEAETCELIEAYKLEKKTSQCLVTMKCTIVRAYFLEGPIATLALWLGHCLPQGVASDMCQSRCLDNWMYLS
jgi:hypothetical protein